MAHLKSPSRAGSLPQGGIPTKRRRGSGRCRQRMKTEILPQRTDQLRVLRRCRLQAETGVEMLRRHIFTAPQAIGSEHNVLLRSLIGGDFQVQVKVRADHQRQMADQHQTICRNIAQKTDGLAVDFIKHSQKIRQLLPLDSPFFVHVLYHFLDDPKQGQPNTSERANASSLSPIPVPDAYKRLGPTAAGHRCRLKLETQL